MIPGMKPMWIAFDRKEYQYLMQTVGWGKRFKTFLVHIIQNSIKLKTFTDKIVLIHSTKKSTDHTFLGVC